MPYFFDSPDEAFPTLRAQRLANWGRIREQGFLRPFLRMEAWGIFREMLIGTLIGFASGLLRSWTLLDYVISLVAVWLFVLAIYGFIDYLAWRSVEREWQARKRTEAEAGQPQSPP